MGPSGGSKVWLICGRLGGDRGVRRLGRRLRIPHLAIEVNEYVGKERALDHTEELDLEGR